MATLRKACRNCTVSKRKCVVQLPNCTRCAQRGLECIYELEPLNTPATQPRKLPNLSWNTSTCDTPGYCLIKSVGSRPSVVDPATCIPGHQDSMELIRLGYQPVPDLVRAGRPAIFVHPKLQLHGNHSHLSAIVETRTVTYESLHHLIQVDLKLVPIREALTALQALIIHLANFATDRQFNMEKYLSILLEWSQTLLASAQARMPLDQSPWQAWLLGESFRRTIIMSFALAMSMYSFNNGYCAYWLFLESLPFDGRAGLWMAESPQAWIAAAGARHGEEVGEQLISFHQFAESYHGSDYDFRGDSFLTLLVFSHNGGRLPSGN
ncbi:hypothetical protein BDW59DRAFT_181201 [Aspergillus cavernicola]|uniref:Zn(2)-C6 fungal-type domain-containing protein n=1 Tax=Aspergillus cavernicola TaxID=176166 RepID=A0ABR4I110_9EURO